MKPSLAWMVIVMLASFAGAQSDSPQPRELGTIPWLRSEADAQAKAKTTGRPILLLFQEVPG